ncbi:hypothetical protein FA15DRAFT_160397 [Coprinopsis marcescibilis]|uniref:Secreted protein n=1 Tax=Coprinopsis marcescibilis TaxID=230819 RepID=A0A5C3LGF2_COPMA|nr:hypothetical protein FA15DRAFT_160397 [Coprinopsis marcescibilis]
MRWTLRSIIRLLTSWASSLRTRWRMMLLGLGRSPRAPPSYHDPRRVVVARSPFPRSMYYITLCYLKCFAVYEVCSNRWNRKGSELKR